MAPNSREIIGSNPTNSNKAVHSKPRVLPIENLQRTVSDISFELTKEAIEDAKCERCGMSEECTAEYVKRVREKFSGKRVCGLCSEAVNEEMEKNAGKRERGFERAHERLCKV